MKILPVKSFSTPQDTHQTLLFLSYTLTDLEIMCNYGDKRN